jgi:hypothetical protein
MPGLLAAIANTLGGCLRGAVTGEVTDFAACRMLVGFNIVVLYTSNLQL